MTRRNESNARSAKAHRLAGAILATTPSTPGALRIVLAGLQTATNEFWETTRRQAGVNPPSRSVDRHLGVSLETRREVVAIVETDLAWLESDAGERGAA